MEGKAVTRKTTIDDRERDSDVKRSKTNLAELQAQLDQTQRLSKRIKKLQKRLWKGIAVLKKGFFASLVALLVEGHNSILQWALIFIEFCQNLAFCFIDIDWGQYGDVLGFILEFTQVEQAVVEYTTPTAIFVLATISLVMIAIMIFLAVYVVRSFVNSDFNSGVWPLRLLRTLVSMLASIFFLPIVYTLFGIFTCKPELGECIKNPVHVTLRILTAILLPLFLMFTLLMSMTYFHPNPKSTSIGARPTARLELVELSSKAILAAVFVFGKSQPIVRAIITFLTAVCVSVFMVLFIPHFDYATSFELACKNFKVEDTNFNTWEIEEQDKKGQEKRFWHPSQVEIATRFLIHNATPEALEVADQMFLFGIQKFPESADLMVSYSIFYLVYKKDESMAANYLKKASASKPFIDTEFTVYQQEQELRNGARTVGNKKLDAVDRVEFKQLIKKATTHHKEAKASIANFWQTIMMADEGEQVDIGTLINLVSQMEWSDKKAINGYRQLLNRFPLSVRVLRNYAVFLEEIHNNRDESKRIQKQIKAIQDAGMSDELASITAQRLAIYSHDLRSKKEKRQYKEYRKQVYLYSKANSSQLHWMVRGIINPNLFSHNAQGVQLVLFIIGLAQLLVVIVGSNSIRFELDWLQLADSCRASLISIHKGLRTRQVFSSLPDASGNLTAALETLSMNSSSLFGQTAARSDAYQSWIVPDVSMDIFQYVDNVPLRTLRNVSMRDATLLYVKRLNDVIKGSNPMPLDLNPDSRFLFDNGLVTLSNAYGKLQFVLANTIQRDIFLLSLSQWIVWGASLLILLIFAFGVFMPVIRRAKIDRETSLRAFLQIPKGVTQVLFRKYYDPGAGSNEDLAGEKDEDKSESDSEEDDDEVKHNKTDTDVLHVKAHTGYFKLTKMYIYALALIAVSYTVALTANIVVGLRLATSPGVLVASLNLRHVVVRATTIVNDVSTFGNSTFNFTNTVRPWVSGSRLLQNDANDILWLESSILYGNESLGIPLQPLPSSYGFSMFGTEQNPTAKISLETSLSTTIYGAVSTFVESTLAVARTAIFAKSEPAVAQIFAVEPIISGGYGEFINSVRSDTSQRLDVFVNVAIGMFIIVVVTIFAIYILFWRRILDYLVKTENERTLKLLLMIPVEIVSDIDSLRELLHLKRTTVSSKVEITGQGAPGNNSNNHMIQTTTSNLEQDVFSGNFRRAPGYARSRPISMAMSNFDANVMHTRILSETPEISPADALPPLPSAQSTDETCQNAAIVANFMHQTTGMMPPPSNAPGSNVVESLTRDHFGPTNFYQRRRSSFSSLHNSSLIPDSRLQGEKRSVSSDIKKAMKVEEEAPPVPPIPANLKRDGTQKEENNGVLPRRATHHSQTLK
ncbi:hypothetical protein HDU97_002784 [Phlyctochytrium planicorne]|nr:hypothetical protein HDU97_002784 [Phlyctochytrium planicorne]